VTDKPTVLFVCHHNANRSQIAAGYLERLAGDSVEVLSAGPEPGEALNPAAVEAMAEHGIDLSNATPVRLTDDAVRSADVVVTLSGADACPVHQGRRYEDWQLDRPAAQGIDAARAIRDQIKVRVDHLFAGLST
jgi:arsenate reductase (thioredoxin)